MQLLNAANVGVNVLHIVLKRDTKILSFQYLLNKKCVSIPAKNDTIHTTNIT